MNDRLHIKVVDIGRSSAAQPTRPPRYGRRCERCSAKRVALRIVVTAVDWRREAMPLAGHYQQLVIP